MEREENKRYNDDYISKELMMQYQDDLHDMLDDLSQPNQSMTISNLSAISQLSPFRNNYGNAFGAGNTLLSGLTSHRGIKIRDVNESGSYSSRIPGSDRPMTDRSNDDNFQKIFQKKKQDYFQKKLQRTSEDITDEDFEISADTAAGFSQFRGGQLAQTKQRVMGQDGTSDGGNGFAAKNRTFADEVMLMGMVENQGMRTTNIQINTQNISPHKNLINGVNSKSYMNLEEISENIVDQKAFMKGPMQCEDLSAVSDNLGAVIDADGATVSHNNLTNLDKSDLYGGAMSDISGLYPHKSPFLMRFDDDAPSTPNGGDSSRRAIASKNQQHKDAPQTLFGQMGNENKKQKTLQSFHSPSIGSANQNKRKQSSMRDDNLRESFQNNFSANNLQDAQAQIQSLSQKLETEKLLSQCLKKEIQEAEQNHSDEIQALKEQSYQIQQDLTFKLQQMDGYIRQILEQYNQKEAELDKSNLLLKETSDKLLSLEKENEVIKTDLAQFTQRCQALEKDLRGRMNSGQQQEIESYQKEMEFQLKKLSEQSQKQISQLKEEKQNLQQQLKESQAYLKQLKNIEDLQVTLDMKNQEVERFTVFYSNLQQLAENSQTWLLSFQEGLSDDELDQQMFLWVQRLVQIEQQEPQLIAQINNLQKRNQELEPIIKSQQQSCEEQNQEIISLEQKILALQAQAQGPSSFTKTLLLEKDKLIEELSQRLENLSQDFNQLKTKLQEEKDEMKQTIKQKEQEITEQRQKYDQQIKSNQKINEDLLKHNEEYLKKIKEHSQVIHSKPILCQVETQADREIMVDQNTETDEVLQIEANTQVNFIEDQEILINQQLQTIQKQQLELDTAYQQISSLEQQIASFDKEALDDQNQQQSVLESQKKSLEFKIQKLQSSLDDLENKNLGLQKELSIQNKQLEAKEKSLCQLKTELQEVQTKAKQLNNQLVQEKIKTDDAKRAASQGTLGLQKAIEEQCENKWKKEKDQMEKEHHNLLKTQITEQIKKNKEEMNQLEEILTQEFKNKFKNDLEQEKKSLRGDLLKDFENKYQKDLENQQNKYQKDLENQQNKNQKDLENQQKQLKSELQNQFEHTVRDKEQQWKAKFQQIESEVQNMVNQHQQELAQQANKFEEKLNKVQIDQKMEQKETSDDKNLKKESEDLVRILKYEFDKILLSLKVKSQNLSQEQLNQKRSEINKKIQQILTDTDQAIALRLKDQMDEVKRQISEILKLFKDQLEAKSKKKEYDLTQKIEEMNNNFEQLQSQVNDTDRSNQEIIKLSQLNQQQKREIEDLYKQIEQVKQEKQEQPQQNQVLNVLQQILANQQKNVPEATKSPQNNTQKVPKLIFNSQINKVSSPCPIPKQKLTSKARQDAFSDFDNHELHLLNHQKFLRMQQVCSQNTFLNSMDQAQAEDDYYQENNNQFLALDQSIEQDNQINYQSATHQQQEDYDPMYTDQSAVNISQNQEPIKMNKIPSRLYTDQGRKQGNIEQESSQSSANNLVNFDSISQDQAVDLLAKVFQKLGVRDQQPFAQMLKAGMNFDGLKRTGQKSQQFVHGQQKKIPLQVASGGSNRTAYRQLEILQSISQAGPDDHLFQMENQHNVTAGIYGQYNIQHDTSILSGGPNQFGKNNIGSDNFSQNNVPNTPSNFLEQRQGRLVQNGSQYLSKQQQQQLRIFPQDSEGDQEDQHRSQLDFYYAQETEDTKLNQDEGSDQEEFNQNEKTFPAGDVFIRQAEDLIKRFGSQKNIKDHQQRNEEIEDRPLKTAGKITPFGKQGRFGSASQSRADDSIINSQSKTNNHAIQQLQNKIQSLNFRSIDAHPTSGQIIKNLNLQLPSVNSSMISKQVGYGSVQQPWTKGKTAKLQNMTLSADIENYKRVVSEQDYQKLQVKAFRSIGEEQFLNNRHYQQNTIDPNELGSLEIMRGNYQEINMDETIDEGIISKNRYPSMEQNDQKETIQLFDCRELRQSKDGKVKSKVKQHLLPRPPRYQTDQQEEFDDGSNTENHYDSKIKAGVISRKGQVYRSLSGRMVKQIGHNAY